MSKKYGIAIGNGDIEVPIIDFMGGTYKVIEWAIDQHSEDILFADELYYTPLQRDPILTLKARPVSDTLYAICDGYRNTIEKVIFNDPATIVFWKDGTKTVVKCQPGCEYSKYVGFMACVTKKVFGNKGNFNDTVNYWLEHGEDHSDGNASE